MSLRLCEITYPPWRPRELSDTNLKDYVATELDLDNSELEGFYKKEMPNINKILLRVGMNHEIAAALTKKIMESLFHEVEWKDFAYEFGYRDEVINSIPYKAKLTNSHPFYFFLSDNDLLRTSNATWGALVQVFLQQERYDLLEALYPYIFDIKRESNSRKNNESSTNVASTTLSPEFRREPHNWSDSQESQISSIEDNTQIALVSELESEYRNNLNIPLCTNNETQNSIPFRNNVTKGMVSLEDHFRFGRVLGNQVTIFISHTLEDYELALDVAIKSRKKGFVTFVQGDEDASFFRMGEGRAVKNIKEKIDFFVPIVTREYLRQIEITDESDSDQLLVRYIFHTYQGQFVDDQCVNRYVKPLVPKGVDKKLVKKHVELRMYMNLWEQFDRFCNLLTDTKRHNNKMK